MAESGRYYYTTAPASANPPGSSPAVSNVIPQIPVAPYASVSNTATPRTSNAAYVSYQPVQQVTYGVVPSVPSDPHFPLSVPYSSSAANAYTSVGAAPQNTAYYSQYHQQQQQQLVPSEPIRPPSYASQYVQLEPIHYPTQSTRSFSQGQHQSSQSQQSQQSQQGNQQYQQGYQQSQQSQQSQQGYQSQQSQQGYQQSSVLSQADLRREYLRDQGYYQGTPQQTPAPAPPQTRDYEDRRGYGSTRNFDLSAPPRGDDQVEMLKSKIADLERLVRSQESELQRTREEYQQKIDDLEKRLASTSAISAQESAPASDIQVRLSELERKYGRKQASSFSSDTPQSSRSFKFRQEESRPQYEFGRSLREDSHPGYILDSPKHTPANYGSSAAEFKSENVYEHSSKRELPSSLIPQLALSPTPSERGPLSPTAEQSYRSISNPPQNSVASTKMEPRHVRIFKGDQIIFTVVSARNLSAKDKENIDPFVSIVFGRQEAKTGVQKRTQKPSWKESFSFAVFDTFEKVKVTIHDADQAPPGNILGRVNIPLQSLQEIAWYELEDQGKYAGEIKIQVRVAEQTAKQPASQLESAQDDAVDAYVRPKGEARSIPQSALPATPKPREVQLSVDVVQAQGLASKDITGSSDPYVVLKIAGQEQKSSVVKRSLNPKWNQVFFFDGVARDQELNIAVYDWDRIGSNELIGSVSIPIDKLGDAHEDWYQLTDRSKKGDQKTGSIFLRLQLQ